MLYYVDSLINMFTCVRAAPYPSRYCAHACCDVCATRAAPRRNSSPLCVHPAQFSPSAIARAPVVRALCFFFKYRRRVCCARAPIIHSIPAHVRTTCVSPARTLPSTRRLALRLAPVRLDAVFAPARTRPHSRRAARPPPSSPSRAPPAHTDKTRARMLRCLRHPPRTTSQLVTTLHTPCAVFPIRYSSRAGRPRFVFFFRTPSPCLLRPRSHHPFYSRARTYDLRFTCAHVAVNISCCAPSRTCPCSCCVCSRAHSSSSASRGRLTASSPSRAPPAHTDKTCARSLRGAQHARLTLSQHNAVCAALLTIYLDHTCASTRTPHILSLSFSFEAAFCSSLLRTCALAPASALIRSAAPPPLTCVHALK
jgi:hypothetical protein